MRMWLARLLVMCRWFLHWLLLWLMRPYQRKWARAWKPARLQTIHAQPKPKWVRNEVICLKALMPQAGCRTIAHHFNRRWAARRATTVSKTYVADTCRRHQYLIYEARRKMHSTRTRGIHKCRMSGLGLGLPGYLKQRLPIIFLSRDLSRTGPPQEAGGRRLASEAHSLRACSNEIFQME